MCLVGLDSLLSSFLAGVFLFCEMRSWWKFLPFFDPDFLFGSEVRFLQKERHGTPVERIHSVERKKQELEGVGLKIQGFREDLEEILPSISKRERADEELRVQLKQQRESLYNDFQFRWKDLEEKYKDSQLNEKEESEGFRTIQKEIRELGSFKRSCCR